MTHEVEQVPFGKHFTDNEGKTLDIEYVLEAHITVLFFTASWFRKCNELSDKLIEFYRLANSKIKVLEVIQVSNEKYENAFNNQRKDKPWVFVPYGDCMKVFDNYNVTEVPHIYIVTKKGEILSTEGKKDILEVGQEVIDEWKKIVNKKNQQDGFEDL